MCSVWALDFFVRIDGTDLFPSWLTLFGLLVFILVVMSLVCQYHSQAIGWKDPKETSHELTRLSP